MAVYVDNARLIYGRMKMCHMIADTTDDLLNMVDAIGIDRKWIQKSGTHHEHFDICMTKRKMAVSLGAIEVSNSEIGRIMLKRRSARQ